MRVGLFELRDGVTPERADRFARTIDAIDYPWRRIIPALRTDPDRAVVVKWDALQQNVTGLFVGRTYEIHLSERDRDASSEPFVVAHEVGHLVDRATFRRDDRFALIDLMHRDPPVQIGHFDHDHPDAGHSVERWATAEPYTARINEAYADLFVAAFAPTIWDGTEFGVGQRWPRFVHWTHDHDAIRDLTLQRSITVYPDVGADHPLREEIERAAELGLLTGYADGTFRPGQALTRAQAAAVAVRQYDKLRQELTS